MPQSSDELRAYWGGVEPRTAMEYLEDRGYRPGKNWSWIPPNGLTYDTMPERDYKAIQFLIEEWDYGGLAE